MKATAQLAERSLGRLLRYAEYDRELVAAAIRQGDGIKGKV
jgi:hypothetical protein